MKPMNTEEVAEKLGCSRQWVLQLIKLGKLEARKEIKRFAYYVTEEQLQEYLAKKDKK